MRQDLFFLLSAICLYGCASGPRLGPVASSADTPEAVGGVEAPVCTARDIDLPAFILPSGSPEFRSALAAALDTLRCCIPEQELGSFTLQFVRETEAATRASLAPDQGFSPITEHCLQVMLSHWSLPPGPASDALRPPRYDLESTQRAASLRLTVSLR